MTTNRSNEAAFRQALLMSPGERQAVDYKAAIPFDERTEFGLKLVKHILGMANTGGGWIVIGYNDKNLQPDLNLSANIAATYDSTLLSDAVNKCVERGQSLRLSVFKETHSKTQLIHPEIRVEGFGRIPFICRSTKSASDSTEQVLQEGKVYVRRPGAATSEIRTISDWDGLLQLCVSQRRDEYLHEFADLFRRIISGDAIPPEGVDARLNRWIGEMWENSRIQEHLGDEGAYMESAQMLVKPRDSEWTHQDLRKVAASYRWLYRDNLIIPTLDGIEVHVGPPDYPQYWYLDKGGSCYRSRSVFENHERPSLSTSSGHPPKSLWVDVTIHRIALELLQSMELYRALGVPSDEPYVFSIRHGGLRGRVSYAADSRYIGYVAYSYSPRISQEDSHVWRKEVTQDLVKGQLVELTHQIASELFALFNFTEIPMGVVRAVLAESRTERGEPLLP